MGISELSYEDNRIISRGCKLLLASSYVPSPPCPNAYFHEKAEGIHQTVAKNEAFRPIFALTIESLRKHSRDLFNNQHPKI